jgi:endogenous inhibitor of DNA gyrase (YacG/DUF329 family)
MTKLKMFCSQCGREFQIERRTGRRPRFCSEACGQAWRELGVEVATEMQCAQCGSTFPITRRRRGRHLRFCSEACRVARRADQAKRYKDEGRYSRKRTQGELPLE